MKLWATGDSSSEALIEQFTAGDDVTLDERLWRYDILASLAHAQMLFQIAILKESELDKICHALKKLIAEPARLTPADEDVHTKLENLLVERIGEAGKRIHTARSRNDQVLVALRLYAKEKLIEIAHALLGLAETAREFAQLHEWQPMPGFTHTRAAMLSSVGLWAGAFSESLLESHELLESAYLLIDQNPLGAAAGYGVPLEIDRALTTQLLGFSRTQHNALAVMNSRGKIEYALQAALGAVLIDLNRIASDLILFTGSEFGFFALPERFCTGSSIMPHKQNPDVLELVRARSSQVLAGLTHQVLIIKNLTSGYHRDLQETKRPLFEALSTTFSCLAVMTPLMAELRVNEKSLNAALAPEIFTVDEVIELVRSGTPLRDAYRQIKASRKQTKHDPVRALKARSHAGGPGNLGLTALKKRITEHKKTWSARQRKFDGAMKKLLTPEA